MSRYIDTSVLVAFYVPEGLSDAAERVLISLATPCISSLTELEMHSAIARKVRMEELSREFAWKALNSFRIHVKEGYYRLLDIEVAHYAAASERIAGFTVPLRALDALHLATASDNGLRMVTADEVLADAFVHFGGDADLLSA